MLPTNLFFKTCIMADPVNLLNSDGPCCVFVTVWSPFLYKYPPLVPAYTLASTCVTCRTGLQRDECIRGRLGGVYGAAGSIGRSPADLRWRAGADEQVRAEAGAKGEVETCSIDSHQVDTGMSCRQSGPEPSNTVFRTAHFVKNFCSLCNATMPVCRHYPCNLSATSQLYACS